MKNIRRRGRCRFRAEVTTGAPRHPRLRSQTSALRSILSCVACDDLTRRTG